MEANRAKHADFPDVETRPVCLKLGFYWQDILFRFLLFRSCCTQSKGIDVVGANINENNQPRCRSHANQN